MSSQRSLALPAAIVVGSVVIGVSLYLGLREGLRPPPASPVPATGVSAPGPATPPAAQAKHTLERPKGEPPADRAFRQAQAALDLLRPGLVKACWTPPGEGEPAAILLTYDVTFGADGTILALGVSEQREAYRSSVAECIRQQPRPKLPVDPPGESVRVILGLPMP
jgi:hypothetical protein